MSQEEYNKQRLGKIVELAKRGVEGERQNAIALVKKMCKEHNLDFDSIMSDGVEGLAEKEYELHYKKNAFYKLAIHVWSRYGRANAAQMHKVYTRRHKIYYVTTLQKHIEVLNAFAVLHQVYAKDKKMAHEAFEVAFMSRHKLYYYYSDEEAKDVPDKELTADEKRKQFIASQMQDMLTNVQVRKQLE